MPRRIVWASALLLLQYVLQFVLIKVPQQFGLDALRALHPVNALGMFALTIALLRQAWAELRQG